MASRPPRMLLLFAIFLIVSPSVLSYDRPPPRPSRFVYLSDQLDSSSPQQVHISLVANDKMRISWITDDNTPSIVRYGASPAAYDSSANGTTSSYTYVLYQSGQIHNVVIGPLKPNTTYYYQCGLESSQELSFKTPPAQFPIKFAIVGDLGQTDWTASTLDHISKSNYDLLLLPGDLAYADMEQPLWDSFGRLVETLASQRPWMVTQGNHEVETSGVHTESFTSYNARWQMPYKESGSDSNLYYSFEVAGVHVIMLGSYTDFDPNSAQYRWLQGDLNKVDRSRTPWLIVNVHAPWYSSNKAHEGEPESVDMKASMEDLLYNARVNVVFAGHVHAYERFTRVYGKNEDDCGPVYITIGDGGNREGLAKKYKKHQPDISLFREASFGHGEFQIVNTTHALWTWHRNDDDESVEADSVWLTNISSFCK